VAFDSCFRRDAVAATAGGQPLSITGY